MTEDTRKKRTLYTLHIVGTQFHPGKDLVGRLPAGTELRVDPEPTNKFDPNAVRLLKDDTMLGYVPATHAQGISVLLAHDFALRFVIVGQKNKQTLFSIVLDGGKE